MDRQDQPKTQFNIDDFKDLARVYDVNNNGSLDAEAVNMLIKAAKTKFEISEEQKAKIDSLEGKQFKIDDINQFMTQDLAKSA